MTDLGLSIPAGAAARAADPSFDAVLAEHGRGILLRRPVTTLQINVTLRCNLACHHCHVESSPKRKEAMDERTVARILELLEQSPDVRTLDITGGAPEMHPGFRELVRGARSLGRDVIDRCNLTILYEEGFEDIGEFLAEQGAIVVASLPCYSKENVEAQRGRNVFDRSIEALRQLNRLGYAQPESRLRLDLVYNPLGPSLPPAQKELEGQYRKELWDLFQIRFNQLYTITNMPIRRFGDQLRRRNQYSEYMSLLVNHFNPVAADEVMCRDLVSVSHDGTLYDCDFNHALGMPLLGASTDIWSLESLSELEDQPISTASHCFACTAGSGSSCGGALV